MKGLKEHVGLIKTGGGRLLKIPGPIVEKSSLLLEHVFCLGS